MMATTMAIMAYIFLLCLRSSAAISASLTEASWPKQYKYGAYEDRTVAITILSAGKKTFSMLAYSYHHFMSLAALLILQSIA
jgi:hypothetical protein